MDFKHRLFSTLLFTLVIVLYVFFNVNINHNEINNILTIFSIILGFYIAAVSIFFSSSYFVELYHVDINNGTDKELYRVMRYIKEILRFTLLTIMYIITLEVFSTDYKTTSQFFIYTDFVSRVYGGAIVGLTFVNLYYTYLILMLFLDSLKDEAVKEAKKSCRKYKDAKKSIK